MPRLNLNQLLPNPNRKTLTLILTAAILSLLSYLAGIYSNSLPSPLSSAATSASATCVSFPIISSPNLDFLTHHTAIDSLPPIPSPEPKLPFCPSNFTDYISCHNPNRERFFSTRNFRHQQRHCPAPEEKPRCRVSRSTGYRGKVSWPESRERVWFKNVPSKLLTEVKKDQNWVRLEGEWLVFPGGGMSFPHGVKWYAEELGRLVPLGKRGVRTVLDIGCGVSDYCLVGNVIADS